jgi:hypothetical protein
MRSAEVETQASAAHDVARRGRYPTFWRVPTERAFLRWMQVTAPIVPALGHFHNG